MKKTLFLTALLGAVLAAPAWSGDLSCTGDVNNNIDITSAEKGDTITFDMYSTTTNTNQNYFNKSNASSDANVVIGAGNGGLVINNGYTNTVTFNGTVTGSGAITKTGNGDKLCIAFAGNATGYTGNITLGSTITFTLRFGAETAADADTTTSTTGISGTGDITFNGANDTVVYNYASSDNPVYITNAIKTGTNGTSKITLKGGASYTLTKSSTINSLSIDSTSSLALTQGSVTLAGRTNVTGTMVATGSSATDDVLGSSNITVDNLNVTYTGTTAKTVKLTLSNSTLTSSTQQLILDDANLSNVKIVTNNNRVQVKTANVAAADFSSCGDGYALVSPSGTASKLTITGAVNMGGKAIGFGTGSLITIKSGGSLTSGGWIFNTENDANNNTSITVEGADAANNKNAGSLTDTSTFVGVKELKNAGTVQLARTNISTLLENSGTMTFTGNVSFTTTTKFRGDYTTWDADKGMYKNSSGTYVNVNASITNSGTLTFAASNLTVGALTLKGGSLTLGSAIGDHNYNLYTSSVTVSADSTVNANLVLANGANVKVSKVTVTEEGAEVTRYAQINLGCTLTLSGAASFTLSDQVTSDASTFGTVMVGVDGLTNDWDSLIVNGSDDTYYYHYVTESSSNGTYTYSLSDTADSMNHMVVYNATKGTLMVTPEPATATLSLLALAGLAARRRRLR